MFYPASRSFVLQRRLPGASRSLWVARRATNHHVACLSFALPKISDIRTSACLPGASQSRIDRGR
ncbi:unnamed protein product, partial [Nesidiocoris tenuis]